MTTIPYDKLLHAAIGPWCALSGLLAALWLAPGYEQHCAAGAGLAAALGRELWNAVSGGDVSLEDVLATLVGAFPVVAAAG